MAKDLSNSVGIVETKKIEVVSKDSPLVLDSGKSLGPIEVAYETYGQLSEKKDNVILICHALSGNAHLAGYTNQDDKKPGWWDTMVGPGKGIDTDKYFVICSNFLGGCSGTTGPTSINPATGKAYGLEFPIITIGDMVKVQKLLIEKLGIEKLLAVIGGSMGGMQVLRWAIDYPDSVDSAIVIASTARLSAQSIAFDAVGRNAILADNNFADGQYYNSEGPNEGLAIARMIGHITYLSEKGMREKFGRELRSDKNYTYQFKSEFSIETYLDYQGQSFVERFDANSYLYITKAMDYFDLVRDYGSLEKAFESVKTRFMIVSFSSDWLFTPEQSEDMLHALVANNKDVSYCNIDSGYGHDAFLIETKTLGDLISGFVRTTREKLAGRKSNGSFTGTASKGLKMYERAKRTRVDYDLIASMILPNSRVLDVGCGDGELLLRLIEDKNIRPEGIELDQNLVAAAINRGLSVIHRDIEREINSYADDSFDYVILSQTMQTLKSPDKVFKQLLRVGKKVIVSFPNFAYFGSRLQLLFSGTAPITKELPFSWYNSPNIHFLSLKDFEKFCEHLGAKIEKKIPLIMNRPISVRIFPNLLAEQAVYLTSKKNKN